MTTSPRRRPWSPAVPVTAPPAPVASGPVQLVSPPATGPVPVTIGDYTLLARIGEGGMGIVHLARRPGGPRVALKVLRPHIVGDDEARHRLAREVSSLRRIRSPRVAEIVDADPWAPVPYVATRYVPGLSLHDHVLEEGAVEGRDLHHLATCLAQGVAVVHAAGVLHRDVKPANVLMEGRTPVLIDFGLARVADDPRLTHTGWLLGTPGYLAPEILYGDDATTASDVHSWAATVAWAATGRAPFGRGPSMAIMDRVRRGEHDLGGVPVGLRRLLSDALDPEPAHRPTLDQVLAHLAALPPDLRGDVPPVPSSADHTRTASLAVHPRDLPTGPPPTRVLTHQVRPAPPGPARDARPVAPAAPVTPVTPVDPWAPPPRPGLAERLRRGLLLGVLAVDLGVAAAAYPWPTLLVALLAVWLLRSGSLAASGSADRRRRRGPRWHDGPQVLLRAPWDLLRSVPGTVVLVLWSLGLALSAALLCYAAATSVPVALGVVGTVLGVAAWTGPGGSRVRTPLGRVVRPAARGWRGWLVAVVVAGGVGLGLGTLVAQQGTDWTPGQERPLSGGWSDVLTGLP